MSRLVRYLYLLSPILAGSLGLSTLLEAQTVDLEPGAVSTSSPALAPLPGGQVLAAWARDRFVPLSFGGDHFVPDSLVFQRREADLSPIGPIITVRPAGERGALLAPRVATTTTGAQFVWALAGDFSFLIEGRAMTEGRLKPRQALGGCEAGRLRGIRLVPAAQGSWVVWNQLCRDGFRITAQRLDSSGRPAGDPRVVAAPRALPSEQFDVAPLLGGGFVAAWVQTFRDETGTDRQLAARAFAGNGKPLAPAFRVTPSVSDPPAVAITTTPSGSIRIAWTLRGPSLVTRTFDVDGTPLGLALAVTERPETIRDPRFVEAQGGDVLTWERFTGPCNGRWIDKSGPRGAEREVAPICQATAIAGNRIIAGWQQFVPRPPGAGPENVARARSLPFPFLH